MVVASDAVGSESFCRRFLRPLVLLGKRAWSLTMIHWIQLVILKFSSDNAQSVKTWRVMKVVPVDTYQCRVPIAWWGAMFT